MLLDQVSSNFVPTFGSTSIHVMHNDKLLILRRHPCSQQVGTWGVPGREPMKHNFGSSQNAVEVLREQTGIWVTTKRLRLEGRYAIRYRLQEYWRYIYRCNLFDMPDIVLHQIEHIEFAWVTPQEAHLYEMSVDDAEIIRRSFQLQPA